MSAGTAGQGWGEVLRVVTGYAWAVSNVTVVKLAVDPAAGTTLYRQS